MLISSKNSFFLVVDMQERLLPAMATGENVEKKCSLLIKTAKALAVPLVVSEQYPKGLGRTVQTLRSEIGNTPVFEKTAFSCWRDAGLKQHLIAQHEDNRPQVIISGIEAHVCVLQTAIDLANAGFGVFVVSDAIASRAENSVTLAIDRMRQSDVQVVNSEMVVFELLGQAGTPEFKTLSALIR